MPRPVAGPNTQTGKGNASLWRLQSVWSVNGGRGCHLGIPSLYEKSKLLYYLRINRFCYIHLIYSGYSGYKLCTASSSHTPVSALCFAALCCSDVGDIAAGRRLRSSPEDHHSWTTQTLQDHTAAQKKKRMRNRTDSTFSALYTNEADSSLGR